MIFKKSVTEKVTSKIAPIVRRLTNVSLRMLGYPTQILRIIESTADLMGDSTSTYDSQIINNAIIDLPFSEVEMLATRDTSDQAGKAFSLMELLTINMYIPFEGDTDTDAIQLDENDIIVLVIFDAYDNKIPIKFKGPKMVSGMIGRYEGLRRYELTLVRGILETEIETRITDYVNSLGTPEVSSIDPEDEETGVSVSSAITIIFNMAMNTSGTEAAITIAPSAPTVNTWNSTSKTLTMTPSGDLSTNTEYTLTISTDAENEGNIPLSEDYTISFTTEV